MFKKILIFILALFLLTPCINIRSFASDNNSTSKNLPQNEQKKKGKEYRLKQLEKSIRYAKRRKALAVCFVIKNLPPEETERKWIDIIDYEPKKSNLKMNFTYVKFALYDRKINPSYPTRQKNMTYREEEKYYLKCRRITSITAEHDIEQQKLEGITVEQREIR